MPAQERIIDLEKTSSVCDYSPRITQYCTLPLSPMTFRKSKESYRSAHLS